MVRAPAVLVLKAKMPCLVVPFTAPVAVTVSAPVPELSARMPSRLPETAAAEMVRLVPVLLLKAAIPRPYVPVPVTVPLAVTDSAPEPLLLVLMPSEPPETAAAEMVRLVPVLELLA